MTAKTDAQTGSRTHFLAVDKQHIGALLPPTDAEDGSWYSIFHPVLIYSILIKRKKVSTSCSELLFLLSTEMVFEISDFHTFVSKYLH